MARRSKSDFYARKAQNKGVAHGTVKMGKGGRMKRMYNAKTARWEAIGAPLPTASKPKKVAGRGPSLGAKARAAKAATRYTQYQAPKTSWGPAKSSSFFDDPLNLKGTRKVKKPTTTTPSGQKINWFKYL